MSIGKILLVEDDDAIATVMIAALDDEGFAVEHCISIGARDHWLERQNFDVMLTDVILEDGDGLASLKSARVLAPDMPIIVLSAQNTLDTAVRASDSDAFEYFPKPFDLDEVIQAVRQACDGKGSELASPAPAENDGMPLVGRSPAMQGVYRMITRVLRNDLTVLVTGESGTGKELVAEAIHQLGSRRSGPFVAVNAAAIPADLIESELFGHEKGAFTGAIAQAIGKFEQANGGTLFLDEIGDMPAEAQTRLLRTLQSNKIRRVGGRHEIAVDVRIVAATNRDLEELILSGRFREDLFYRLNVVPIHLPPLRERREDIGALAHHFLKQAEKDGLPQCRLTSDAVDKLQSRTWRGNVRELRNVIYRLSLIARDEVIDGVLVTDTLEKEPDSATERAECGTNSLPRTIADWLNDENPEAGTVHAKLVAAVEKPLIEFALNLTDWNQLQAAKWLGINRNTLKKRMVELSIAGHRLDKPM